MCISAGACPIGTIMSLHSKQIALATLHKQSIDQTSGIFLNDDFSYHRNFYMHYALLVENREDILSQTLRIIFNGEKLCKRILNITIPEGVKKKYIKQNGHDVRKTD